MIPAFVAHTSPGRLRIKIPSKKGDRDALLTLKEQFMSFPGVISVDVNPLTGSVLLVHETSFSAIAEHARTRLLLALEEQQEIAKTGPTEFHRSVVETFRGIDGKIRSLTGGGMNAGEVAFVALLGTGTVQILQGNAGPIPWFAALWYAYSVFLKSNGPQE